MNMDISHTGSVSLENPDSDTREMGRLNVNKKLEIHRKVCRDLERRRSLG